MSSHTSTDDDKLVVFPSTNIIHSHTKRSSSAKHDYSTPATDSFEQKSPEDAPIPPTTNNNMSHHNNNNNTHLLCFTAPAIRLNSNESCIVMPQELSHQQHHDTDGMASSQQLNHHHHHPTAPPQSYSVLTPPSTAAIRNKFSSSAKTTTDASSSSPSRNPTTKQGGKGGGGEVSFSNPEDYCPGVEEGGGAASSVTPSQMMMLPPPSRSRKEPASEEKQLPISLPAPLPLEDIHHDDFNYLARGDDIDDDESPLTCGDDEDCPFVPLYYGELRSVADCCLLSVNDKTSSGMLTHTPSAGPLVPFIPGLPKLAHDMQLQLMTQAKGHTTSQLFHRYRHETETLLIPVIEDALSSLIEDSQTAIEERLQHEYQTLRDSTTDLNAERTATATPVEDKRLTKLEKTLKRGKHSDHYKQKPLQMFETSGVPPFPLREYLEILAEETHVSPSSFVGALILLNRLMIKLNGVTAQNVAQRRRGSSFSCEVSYCRDRRQSSFSTNSGSSLSISTATPSSPLSPRRANDRSPSSQSPNGAISASTVEQPLPRPNQHLVVAASGQRASSNGSATSPSSLLLLKTAEQPTLSPLGSRSSFALTPPAPLMTMMTDYQQQNLRERRLYITNLNIMKMFAASLRIASKVLELSTIGHKAYAAAARLKDTSMLSVEEKFIELLDWDVHISPQEFDRYAAVIRGDEKKAQSGDSEGEFTGNEEKTSASSVHTLSGAAVGMRTVEEKGSSDKSSTGSPSTSKSSSTTSPQRTSFVQKIRSTIVDRSTGTQ